jgi:hypothetical protein
MIVMPAKAGIQCHTVILDPRLREDDGMEESTI